MLLGCAVVVVGGANDEQISDEQINEQINKEQKIKSQQVARIENRLMVEFHWGREKAHAWANQAVYLAHEYDVSPYILFGVWMVETGGTLNPNVKGRAGERGICQFLPSTAKNNGYDWSKVCNPKYWHYQMLMTAQHLRGLGDRCGSLEGALYRYNGNKKYIKWVKRAAKKWEIFPLPKEER